MKERRDERKDKERMKDYARIHVRVYVCMYITHVRYARSNIIVVQPYAMVRLYSGRGRGSRYRRISSG